MTIFSNPNSEGSARLLDNTGYKWRGRVEVEPKQRASQCPQLMMPSGAKSDSSQSGVNAFGIRPRLDDLGKQNHGSPEAKEESRGREIRARLAKGRQTPEFARPSLWALTHELGISAGGRAFSSAASFGAASENVFGLCPAVECAAGVLTMRIIIRSFVAVLALVFAVPGWADDQEKATKEIMKIAAIAADSNMRSVVNRTLADMLRVKRLDLVKERQEADLNYGGLFLAHQVTASGAKMEDITAQLKAGKSIFDIANEDHANWKQINSDARKLNTKIDDNIAKYFTDSKKQVQLDQADNYDSKADKVAADSNITKEEYAEAQSRYQRLHDLASSQSPANGQNQGQVFQNQTTQTGGRGSR
jgi:hypothetical protein